MIEASGSRGSLWRQSGSSSRFGADLRDRRESRKRNKVLNPFGGFRFSRFCLALGMFPLAFPAPQIRLLRGSLMAANTNPVRNVACVSALLLFRAKLDALLAASTAPNRPPAEASQADSLLAAKLADKLSWEFLRHELNLYPLLHTNCRIASRGLASRL